MNVQTTYKHWTHHTPAAILAFPVICCVLPFVDHDRYLFKENWRSRALYEVSSTRCGCHQHESRANGTFLFLGFPLARISLSQALRRQKRPLSIIEEPASLLPPVCARNMYITNHVSTKQVRKIKRLKKSRKQGDVFDVKSCVLLIEQLDFSCCLFQAFHGTFPRDRDIRYILISAETD